MLINFCFLWKFLTFFEHLFTRVFSFAFLYIGDCPPLFSPVTSSFSYCCFQPFYSFFVRLYNFYFGNLFRSRPVNGATHCHARYVSTTIGLPKIKLKIHYFFYFSFFMFRFVVERNWKIVPLTKESKFMVWFWYLKYLDRITRCSPLKLGLYRVWRPSRRFI